MDFFLPLPQGSYHRRDGAAQRMWVTQREGGTTERCVECCREGGTPRGSVHQYSKVKLTTI